MRGALALAVWLLASATAHAEAMRCGTHLVPEGSTLERTLAECGAPTTRRTHVAHQHYGRADRHGNVTVYEQDVVVDELRYEFGAHEFIYDLTFNDGHMVSMVKNRWK